MSGFVSRKGRSRFGKLKRKGRGWSRHCTCTMAEEADSWQVISYGLASSGRGAPEWTPYGLSGIRAGPPYLSESVTVLALIHRSNHLACS